MDAALARDEKLAVQLLKRHIRETSDAALKTVS
jgi:DNA-binding GntR family transcriptional regulator